MEAYTLALAFPVNADQPIIWWEAANLYLSQGSYEGALSILDRIILDFPDYARINSVLICRAAVYRRMQCVVSAWTCVLLTFHSRVALFLFHSRFDEAVKDFLTVVQRKLPEPYTFSDIMTHIAWCYELHGDSADNRHHSYDSRGAFATAYQALHDKVECSCDVRMCSDVMEVSCHDNSPRTLCVCLVPTFLRASRGTNGAARP